MASVQKGFYWHVHHEKLLEYCYSYAERAEYIRLFKAFAERALRFRLFQPVKSKLPQDLVRARLAWAKAKEAAHKADQAYAEARRAHGIGDEARRAWDKAWRAGSEAVEAHHDYNDALAKNMPTIEALHKQECPDCPWDGKTIFPIFSAA